MMLCMVVMHSMIATVAAAIAAATIIAAAPPLMNEYGGTLLFVRLLLFLLLLSLIRQRSSKVEITARLRLAVGLRLGSCKSSKEIVLWVWRICHAVVPVRAIHIHICSTSASRHW